MCSALCAENNLVFGNEERFCQFWNAMSRWICKWNIKQAALLLVARLHHQRRIVIDRLRGFSFKIRACRLRLIEVHPLYRLH